MAMTPKQRLDALAALLAPEIQDAFLRAIQNISDEAIVEDVAARIERGDYLGAMAALNFSPGALRPITAAIERAYERSGNAVGDTFPKYLNTPAGRVVFHFDARNYRAEDWLRRHSSELITRLTDDARDNVRAVLQRGMAEGRNPRNVALDIVGRYDSTAGHRIGGVIGLTRGLEAWSESARQRLLTLDEKYFTMELRDKRFDATVRAAIATGKPLPAGTVEKLVTRYKDRALKYRGEMIGRTEAMQSLNAADYEATKQAVETGALSEDAVEREWDDVGDNRVRHTHRVMNKQRVGLDEPFKSPSGALLLYPGDTSLGAGANEVVGCRCRVRNVIDWFAGVE